MIKRKKMTRWAGILLIYAGVSFSCKPIPRDCKEYSDMSFEKRRKFTTSNPVEKNFELLRCRNYVEGLTGPNLEIIEGGAKNVPFLLSKMNDSKIESEQEDAIFLLAEIDQNEPLSNRNEIIINMEKIIQQMKSEMRRENLMDSLRKMKER